MPGNSFGKIFKFSTWGESHGPAIGCTIDGAPSKISINEKEYPLPPVGIAAQEIIIKGGLENWVKEKI